MNKHTEEQLGQLQEMEDYPFLEGQKVRIKIPPFE